jgi:hypothetical protein
MHNNSGLLLALEGGALLSYGGNMNTEEIIEQIDAEISKLQQAKGPLLGTCSRASQAWARGQS